ncbi:hypothetical protein S7335_2889 [Synechococcus sp. PCC 7335]|nr:hypothetical protein S7335_2889 [Synechococcus sp. PCC 7335]
MAVILPVLAGLLVTNRLQLRGANALIANLVIAAISRQIIHQLTQEAAVISAGANGVSAVEKPSPLATEPVYQVDEDYKIMHSVAGRIRLQVRQLQADRNFAKRLERLLLEDPIVSGVRINRAAASIVIQYTAGELSEAELGLRLLQILDEAAAPAVTTTAAATA